MRWVNENNFKIFVGWILGYPVAIQDTQTAAATTDTLLLNICFILVQKFGEKKNKKLKNVSKFRLNIAKISIRFVEKFEVKDENFVIICVTSATDCNFRVGLSWLIPWLLGFPKVAPLGTGRLRPPRRTRILKMTKPVWISQVKMQYYKFECLEWRETSRKVV